MSLPDLESLRCFEAAAVHLNFRAGAAHVGLSPAAFSDRIKRLEAQLGARLFERTTRRVRLTAAGNRLLEQARRTLKAAAGCREVVTAGAQPARFELSVGTRYELGMSWLVPALGELAAARPERRIRLGFGTSADLMGRLLRGRLDAIITSARLTEAQLEYARLHEETYVLCAAPKLVDERPLARPEDARAHVLLDAHPDLPLFRYLLDARPPEEVWAFHHIELLGTIAAIRYRALEGAGVCVLPRYFVQPDLDGGALVDLLPNALPRTDFFRLIWRSGHSAVDELQSLAVELRERPLC